MDEYPRITHTEHGTPVEFGHRCEGCFRFWDGSERVRLWAKRGAFLFLGVAHRDCVIDAVVHGWDIR